jgi:hypothetical protein
VSKDFDQATASRLNAAQEKLLDKLEAALEKKVMVRVERNCKKCGCSHIEMVEHDDVPTMLKVAQFMAERGLGKPAQRVVVEHNVDLTAMTLSAKVVYLEQLRAQRAALEPGDDAA